MFDDKDIINLFPIKPIKSFRTTGQQLGQVIKFRTFYLKIYDEDINSYLIEGYRYSGNIPDLVFTEIIKYSDMRKWASQFTSDNYLEGYQEFYR